MAAAVIDALDRPLGTLRLSVTDRCNLRCSYCMPEEHYNWLPRAELLRFEEIARLARLFTDLGVGRIRLTGGEPLLRRGLPELIGLLRRVAPAADLALTTNGVTLAGQCSALRDAGLQRVTISLDTLDPDRFGELTRRPDLPAVLESIAAARRAGFALKLNTVVMRGFNDDELIPLVEYAGSVPAELRFIEYMDVGGATRWSAERVVSRAEILDRLAPRFGPIQPLPARGAAPAERFRLADGRVIGIIASTSAPFCRDCDRVRLTADGTLFTCLYATEGVDLRGPIRSGAGDAEIVERITAVWRSRRDRGAELRAMTRDRRVFIPVEALRRDPRLEMHTRGG
ncbi:MAG: GTP 3',8-cyclase MoaA [Phycisphaerales bacterium]|nr:GTP 3',8-cyclase MoaA [Phycisphaerales bacterium]